MFVATSLPVFTRIFIDGGTVLYCTCNDQDDGRIVAIRNPSRVHIGTAESNVRMFKIRTRYSIIFPHRNDKILELFLQWRSQVEGSGMRLARSPESIYRNNNPGYLVSISLSGLDQT